MPRNSVGAYSLPSGNPVVSGTSITSSWANTTMADLGAEIQSSLDRSGRGPMLAPLKAFSGLLATPGITFADELTTGFFRKSGGSGIGIGVLGTQIGEIAATGAAFQIKDGTAAAPSVAFGGLAAGTGLFRSGSTGFGVAVGGVQSVIATRNTGTETTAQFFYGFAGGFGRSVQISSSPTATSMLFDASVSIDKVVGNNSLLVRAISGNTNLAINTANYQGTLDVSNPIIGSVVTTSIHLGYSEGSFYGYRLTNTSNPTTTAAGTFSLQRGNTSAWVDVLTSDNAGRVAISSGLLLTSLLTISQLPAANSVPGTRAMVSDASNGVFRAVVVGGGATIVPVHSDGTNWVIG